MLNPTKGDRVLRLRTKGLQGNNKGARGRRYINGVRLVAGGRSGQEPNVRQLNVITPQPTNGKKGGGRGWGSRQQGLQGWHRYGHQRNVTLWAQALAHTACWAGIRL